MTLKATALLSIAAIWGAAIAVVVVQGDVWWTLVFAILASGAVGLKRSLGLARVLAIAAPPRSRPRLDPRLRLPRHDREP